MSIQKFGGQSKKYLNAHYDFLHARNHIQCNILKNPMINLPNFRETYRAFNFKVYHVK